MTAVRRASSRLSVAMSQRGADVRIAYSVDDLRGAIDVRYPHPLGDLELATLPAVGVGIATYLGQLCLASEIAIEFAADPALAEAIDPIAEMLYDIRCWKDDVDLVDAPRFTFERPSESGPLDVRLDSRQSLLLFSGGKDSTLAALALRRNGYATRGLHATINSGVEDAEHRAVRRLGERLGLDVDDVSYRHPGFRELADRYAVNWGSFPHFNTVPFGRDLAVGVLAMPLLVRHGIGNLSLGHDNDCRNAYVVHQGKTIPRNDIESSRGGMALEAYVRRAALADCRLLPPLARLSEQRILREMLERHPDLMADIAFCFWGENCGRCAKCLRYFLAQRLFGPEDTLVFAVNPLTRGACPELDDILDGWGRERVLFDTEVVYALGRLVERGDVRQGEKALERFRDTLFDEIAPRLDQMGRELDEQRADPQVPDGFAPV